MPGQKIPALVLALVPVPPPGRGGRQGRRRLDVAVALPKLTIKAMHGGKVGPARGIGDRSLLQIANRLRIPQHRGVPVVAEPPKIQAGDCHGSPPTAGRRTLTLVVSYFGDSFNWWLIISADARPAGGRA